MSDWLNIILLMHILIFLSVETAALLANSMISSRIDCCNCSIVFRLDKTNHVTPNLERLHWLPVLYHILFKYNLITSKAIKFCQPTYLCLIKTSSLSHGYQLSVSSICPKRPLVGNVLQCLLPLDGTDSHNQSVKNLLVETSISSTIVYLSGR